MRTIVLEGPKKNALGTRMMLFLKAELDAAAGEPVLLTGAGDAFSAGLDLEEVLSLDHEGMVAFLRRLDDVVHALWTYPGPTVALVNGHAIAGGCILALACDWRVAQAGKAKIGLNEVALGLRFPPAILDLVRVRLPERSWTQAVLDAGLWDPETAKGLGIVHEVAMDAPGVARVALERLGRHPAGAYAATKRALYAGVGATEAERRRYEQEELPAWLDPGLKDRIAGLLAKKG